MATQQTRLFELKDSLDQAESAAQGKAKELAQVTAELDEAKKTILQLTEAKEAPPAPAKVPIRHSGVDVLPRPVQSSSKMTAVDVLPRRPVQPAAKTASKGLSPYAPGPTQSGTMLSDADIGWVD
ncbi:MAG: hypothetical protein HC922_04440 [Leptolyngbyaceae cyanobacterium SM2_3_12]|nr:hypothetical protein [Leptolyngbyaceae cyanobacterium SM2_3_12]